MDTGAVPVERVRLGKQTVTEQGSVSGEVRKEQSEFDGPGGPPRPFLTCPDRCPST